MLEVRLKLHLGVKIRFCRVVSQPSLGGRCLYTGMSIRVQCLMGLSDSI